MAAQSAPANTKTAPRKHSFLSRHWPWLVLLLILAFSAGIRLRLLDSPLERDEGEYAYMGQLMLDGIPPYTYAYNMKFPGTYAAYALIMAVFGQTPAGIHLGVLLVNAAAIVLIFLIARRFWDTHAALMAAAFYGIVTLTQKSLGIAGHATHFVTLAMLVGVILMLNAARNGRKLTYFAAGVLFGLAALMKQPGIMFVPMAVIYIFWTTIRGPRPIQWSRATAQAAAVVAGSAIPLLVTAGILWVAGVFDRFWHWAIVYALRYGSTIPLTYAPQMLVKHVTGLIVTSWHLWLLSAIGFVLICLTRESRRNLPFLATFATFSFLAASMGFHYRSHYFFMFMPALGMSAGAGLYVLRKYLRRFPAGVTVAVTWLIFLGLWSYTVVQERDFLFTMTPDDACRDTYGGNPFVESLEIADYIRRNSQPADTIAVLGSEPQIYFYAHRRSATGYIYMYPLTDPFDYGLEMQKEMTEEIEKARPRYVVFVKVDVSWVFREGSHRYILEWWYQFVNEYELVAAASIFSNTSLYAWDAKSITELPFSDLAIGIYRLKSDDHTLPAQ